MAARFSLIVDHKSFQLARITSRDRNLFDRQSKSLRLNFVLERLRR
jgi:hypothetical protein